MKRTLLFLLCVLMGTQLFSETLFGYLFPTLAYLERTTCHYTEGDEQFRTIDRLSFEDNMFEVDGNTYIEYNNMWLREDKKGRILVYSKPAKKDLVLYDFTLEVGDTLTTLNIDMVPMTEGDPILPGLKSIVVDYPIYINGELSCPIDTLIVTDVSMVMMRDSNEYKKWTFSNGMEYMEYIGNLGADFFPIIKNPWEDIPTCCIEERLVCASIYDRLIYQMDDAEMQRLNAECQCSSWASKWCDTWNVLEFDGMAFEQTAQTWQYKLAYDTIIDGKEYQAVTRHWTAYDESAAEYVAAVRFAENKKAFIYYDNAEYLLYDFGYHEIGDTLEVFSGINNYMHFKTYKCVITDNYSTAGGIAEDTYVMDIIHPITGDTIPSALVWQEFVGSYSGFLHGGLLVPGNSNYQLLCAYKDNVLAYSVDNDAFTDNDTFIEYGCEYNATEQKPKDLFPTLTGLQRTTCLKNINENEVGTVWGSPSYLMQEIETTTIDGKQYLLFGTNNTYDEYCSLWLREENNKILVYSAAQKKDLVLYDFTLNVGDSLPRLYVDEELSSIVDYYKYEADWEYTKPLFVTEVSTITLLDGKEYKKWTFDNGMEYVEGIGSFGTSYAWNDFYQLIANGPLYSDVFSQHLVCVSKNNQLLYQMDEAEMERLGAECLCDVENKWTDTWCDTWNVLEHDRQYSGSGNYNEQTWRHYLAQDTIINGQTYTWVNCYWTLEESKVYRIALVRFTEDKKVYLLSGNQEQLVYDFSVEVGDTIETIVGAFYGNARQQLVVHQVDVDDATNRKTITLYPLCKLEEDIDCDHCDENGYYLDWFPIQWIEGVGSTDGFLMGDLPCSDWVGGIGCNLLCAYKDDELQYISKLYQGDYGCEYNAVEQNAADLFPTLWGLQQTICSGYYGEEGDEWASGLTGPSQEITMMDGKPYLQWGSWYLREENDKILVYSEIQKKDLVLYDFTLELGDTLTTLNLVTPEFLEYEGIVGIVDYPLSDYDYTYPIDTLVVTELSKETLLDGKEYTRWKFSDGTVYVEGIGSMNETFFHHIADHLPVPVSYLGSYLVCVSKNNKLLYQMDDAEMERLGAECLCDYTPTINDNAKDKDLGGRPTPTQWYVLDIETKDMGDPRPTVLRAETFSYTLENDSIVVNGRTFYQLACQSTKDTATTKSVVGALHFSEDKGNRVYFLRDGVEYLLYDFTAEPGDTIEIFAGINNYPQDTTYTHVVADKDTTEDGACRMFLEVVFREETTTVENAEKVWLAGLGSIDGIVHNTAKRASIARSSETQTSIMLCAWREDSCLYTTNHPDYNTLGCVYNTDETSTVEDIHTSPSYQKLLRDGQLLIIHEGKTYNVMGVAVE